MNTNQKMVRPELRLGFLALLVTVFFAGCEDPEPPDPAALIPSWRTYYNREIGIEFKHPYNLKLEVNTLEGGHLSVDLLWVGTEASVFALTTRDYQIPDEGRGSVMVGGKQASQYDEEVAGTKVQQTKVVHKGRVLVFTGEGKTFDKVLDSVKFIE